MTDSIFQDLSKSTRGRRSRSKMTDMLQNSAHGGQIKKEEESSFFSGSAFDSLDILATIATQELKINKNSSENGESLEEDNDEEGEDNKAYAKGSVQPKKLAEMDLVNMEQIKSMSANTLVRIFAETDFDEMKRMYCYSCLLMPGECRLQFKSFGNESKAKKDIRVHLEKHVDELLAKQRSDFTAEPILARKRRIKDLTSYVSTRPQVPPKRRVIQIKEEEGVEKENIENTTGKRRKEDAVPLLAEMTNDQELKRYRVKAEGVEEAEEEQEEESSHGGEREVVEEVVVGEVKQEHQEKKEQRKSEEVEISSGDAGKTVRIAIDEDHCYAFKPGRVKAEYWPEYDLYNSATTAFTATQEEEDDTYTALKGSPPQDMTSVEAIQACPVIMEEELQYQESDYNKDPHYKTVSLTKEVDYSKGIDLNEKTYTKDTGYAKEYVIEPEAIQESPEAPMDEEEEEEDEEEEEEEKPRDGHEFTTIVYQDKVEDPAEQFYTETIVTDVVSAEEYYGVGGQGHTQEGVDTGKPPVRIKNKRTVAAVSSEDKRRALTAMEELRARGATTDDLMCRLCDPARPFTAYSTLLTHYRSHAGLRPFECSLCGATFTRQHSLNYHLMTHANQTRFTCPHCNRKFRHPTHFKEHVKKHGEVVQFLCNFCPASLSTQSQYRKHLKMRHNKTIDIMGNIIDSPPEVKDKERTKRKRRVVKTEADNCALGKRKRRRRTKPDSTEISQYEEVVHSSVDTNPGTVIYEETVPMTESEQMYQNSDNLVTKETYEMYDSSRGQIVHNIQQYVEQPMEPQYLEQYVVTSPTGTQHLTSKVLYSQPQSPVQQKSPMIFVVPNGGQKTEVARKPLIINSGVDQKKPIVISKFQSNGGGEVTESNTGRVGGATVSIATTTATTDRGLEGGGKGGGGGVGGVTPGTQPGETRIKQGVIAQINGQKVLLVPKKKPDHQVHTSLSGQVQPGQVRLASVQSEVRLGTLQTSRSRNVLIQTAGQTNPRVITTLAPPASPLLTRLKQNCLTEIDPNTVQNTNTGSAENPPESNKTNILEQAMHEVFPSDIDFTDQSEETFPDPDGSPQAGDDLYNPMRSPLKNRNKILCEVLGIDS